MRYRLMKTDIPEYGLNMIRELIKKHKLADGGRIRVCPYIYYDDVAKKIGGGDGQEVMRNPNESNFVSYTQFILQAFPVQLELFPI